MTEELTASEVGDRSYEAKSAGQLTGNPYTDDDSGIELLDLVAGLQRSTLVEITKARRAHRPRLYGGSRGRKHWIFRAIAGAWLA